MNLKRNIAVIDSLRHLVVGFLLVCSAIAASAETVGAGSTHIANALREITQGDTTIYTLVPGAMCPSHYDTRPSDIQQLSQCAVILIHPWQRTMPTMRATLDAAGKDKQRLIDIQGNWMVPEVQAEALRAVAGIMAACHPEEAAVYQQRAAARVEAVTAFGARLREAFQKQGMAGIPVLAEKMQAPFVAWTGLRVSGSFGQADAQGASGPAQLLDKAREDKVRLVIGNLQSGSESTLSTLASELKVSGVTLSNFPGAVEGVATWEENLRYNLNQILHAFGKEALP